MTTTDHPVQISLPGQTHVAHGPHDQTGMYVMHHAFRRDLTRFESAVRHTPLGDGSTWRALADRWASFCVTLHHHHQVEDVAFWPTMLRRVDEAGDAGARRTLEAMEAEHEVIDPALAACSRAFADMAEHPCTDHRNALDVRVTDLHAALLDHLRHEESEALPLLQQVMTAEDYAAAEAAARDGYPARMTLFLVCWTLDGVPQDAADRLLAWAGRPYRLLHRLGRRRWRRGEERAFRYA